MRISFIIATPPPLSGPLTGLAVSFGLANSQLNSLLDTAQALTIALVGTGTTYNPSSYSRADLEPYIAETRVVFEHWVGRPQALPLLTLTSESAKQVNMQHLFRIGFTFYVVWTALIIIFFAPFLIRHIVVIRRLLRPTTRSTIGGPLSTAPRTGQPQSPAIAGESKPEFSVALTPQGPLRADSDETLDEKPVTPRPMPTGASCTSNTEQDRNQRALRADLRSLLWSAVVVMGAPKDRRRPRRR